MKDYRRAVHYHNERLQGCDLMKDYRRAVDYHNERLQGCDLMKDYRKVGTAGFPATHYSSGAPARLITHTPHVASFAASPFSVLCRSSIR